MAIDLLLQEAKGLSDDTLMEVVRFIRFIKADSLKAADTSGEKNPEREQKTMRKAGLYKHQIWMSDDFDAPLDEFKEYM